MPPSCQVTPDDAAYDACGNARFVALPDQSVHAERPAVVLDRLEGPAALFSEWADAMNGQVIDAILIELDLSLGPVPELAAVRTALLLEDVFSISLSDDEIDVVHLGNVEAIRELLARHGVPG